MNRILFLISLIVSLSFFFLFLNPIFAGQNDEPDVRDIPHKERIFVGGYFGLQFGNFTFVDVSPLVGYRLTNKLSLGIGITYQYYRESFMKEIAYYEHRYGGKVFLRFNVIPQVFLHSEYEIMNIESLPTMPGNDRFWEQNYFLGAGYRAKLGPKAFFNLMVLYNFNKESYIYDRDVIFRFSIEVGL